MKPHNSPTRVTPALDHLKKMVAILLTIQSFERKVMQVNANISNCEKGGNQYLPYFNQLKKSYEEARLTFQQRIKEEEEDYKVLIMDIPGLIPVPTSVIPELAERVHDDEVEPGHKHCGGHATY